MRSCVVALLLWLPAPAPTDPPPPGGHEPGPGPSGRPRARGRGPRGRPRRAGHGQVVLGLGLPPGGKAVGTGRWDNLVRVLDGPPRRPVRPPGGHKKPVYGVA